MSIFDPTSGKDPTIWLREKSLAALESAVKLVDLANEADTTAWYRKKLRNIAHHLIARLLPMTALFHNVPEQGVEDDQWKGIVENGTFELVKWCNRWKVANPYHFTESLTAVPRDESEITEKRESVQPDITECDNEPGRDLKLSIYQHMALQMLHFDLSDPTKRLLSWALFHLYTSEYADIVILNKSFLPTDIGCSIQETADAYRELYQKGLIEKVEGLKTIESSIALRLVVEGLNESKHSIPFKEEVFGMEGLRIGGEPTTGNIVHLTFDKNRNKYLEWLSVSPAKMQQLHGFLQQTIGADNVYIEKIKVLTGTDGPGESNVLEIKLRYPLSADDRSVEHQLEVIAEKWIREAMVIENGS
jgi:hypothetical protein